MTPRSFTTVSNAGILRVLTNECTVSEAWNPDSSEPEPPMLAFTALWDTGATQSVITQNVVDSCRLVPTGITDVHHAQGRVKDVPVFLVTIGLPNRVAFVGVPVTKGVFPGADVLIGMNIISQGDFAVTNRGGRTKFSFRIPSQADIDFVAEDRQSTILRGQSSPSQRTRERNRQDRKRKKGR